MNIGFIANICKLSNKYLTIEFCYISATIVYSYCIFSTILSNHLRGPKALLNMKFKDISKTFKDLFLADSSIFDGKFNLRLSHILFLNSQKFSCGLNTSTDFQGLFRTGRDFRFLNSRTLPHFHTKNHRNPAFRTKNKILSL